MSTPTQNEIEMATLRAKMAAEEDACRERLVTACGTGADSYAEWVVCESVHGQAGAAVARYPTARREGGRWTPGEPEAALERCTDIEQSFVEANGTRHFFFRYIVSLHTLSNYRPQSAEQLAAAREKREEKRAAELAAHRAMYPELDLA